MERLLNSKSGLTPHSLLYVRLIVLGRHHLVTVCLAESRLNQSSVPENNAIAAVVVFRGGSTWLISLETTEELICVTEQSLEVL